MNQPTDQPSRPEKRPEPNVPPLGHGERVGATLLGLAFSGAGGTATFLTDNGAGSVGLLALGAIFLLMGVVGLVPSRLKMGGNEADLARVVNERVTERVVEVAQDPATPEPVRTALEDVLSDSAGQVLLEMKRTGHPSRAERLLRLIDSMTLVQHLRLVDASQLGMVYECPRCGRWEHSPRGGESPVCPSCDVAMEARPLLMEQIAKTRRQDPRS